MKLLRQQSSRFITSLRHYIIADRFLAHLLRELLVLPASQLFQVQVLAAALRASGVPVGPALPLGDLPQHDGLRHAGVAEKAPLFGGALAADRAPCVVDGVALAAEGVEAARVLCLLVVDGNAVTDPVKKWCQR